MLRLIKSLLLFLTISSCMAFGDGLRSFTTNTVAADFGIPQAGTAIGFHKLSWTTSGTVATCTVALDTSSDGVSWNAGAAIVGQTCTSPGVSTVATAAVNYVRINVTAISGGGSVVATWSGFVSNPGGGGGGTITSCGPGIATYNANGTTITCDPAIVDTNGTLNISQGAITTSQPFLNHTATWNAGAVAFNNWVTNLTCTAAAAASKMFDYQIASTSQFSIGFAAANCAGPRLNLPDGSSTQASLGFGSEAAGFGWYKDAVSSWCLTNVTNCFMRLKNGAGVELNTAEAFSWSSGANATLASDTCMDRIAAGVIRADTNSACNDGFGKLKSAGYMVIGTTFTGNAGCSETTLTGGATAGKFTAVSTSCTIVITMGNSASAPNGWSCTAIDLTTLADVVNPHQTATTVTTATIVTGTIVSGDVIQFSCVGY